MNVCGVSSVRATFFRTSHAPPTYAVPSEQNRKSKNARLVHCQRFTNNVAEKVIVLYVIATLILLPIKNDSQKYKKSHGRKINTGKGASGEIFGQVYVCVLDSVFERKE